MPRRAGQLSIKILGARPGLKTRRMPEPRRLHAWLLTTAPPGLSGLYADPAQRGGRRQVFQLQVNSAHCSPSRTATPPRHAPRGQPVVAGRGSADIPDSSTSERTIMGPGMCPNGKNRAVRRPSASFALIGLVTCERHRGETHGRHSRPSTCRAMYPKYQRSGVRVQESSGASTKAAARRSSARRPRTRRLRPWGAAARAGRCR